MIETQSFPISFIYNHPHPPKYGCNVAFPEDGEAQEGNEKETLEQKHPEFQV